MKRSIKSTELTVVRRSLLPALALLRKNDPLRLAGATAFFTTFALPPIVFILAQLFRLVESPRDTGRGLIKTISNSLGDEGAEQVRQVIRSIRGFSSNPPVIVIGSLFLVFVATTLFIVIKDSINQVWHVDTKKNYSIRFSLLSRLRSLAVIVLAGLLFFVNLFFNSLENFGARIFEDLSRNSGNYFHIVFGEAGSIVITSCWFILVFRFLADGRPHWRAAVAGGLFTGLLFSAGKLLLRVLLINSNIGSLYGSSAAFVLVLLFVFYTSFILYYGACFIAVYSKEKKLEIRPAHMLRT